MNYSKNLSSVSKNGSTTKQLAILSIGVYIICSTIFDFALSGFQSLASLSIYFCLACCSLHVLNRGIFRLNFTIGLLLLFGVFLSVSALYTPADDSVVNMYLYRFWTSAVFAVLAANTISDPEDVYKIIDFYIIAGAVLSVFMIAQYGLFNLDLVEERVGAELGNQNRIGISCAYTVCFSFYRIITQKGKRAVLYAMAIIICIPMVMFTGSRKSLLIILVALLAFIFSYSRNRMLLTRIVQGIAIIIILWLVVYYVPAFQMIKDRILNTVEVFFSDSGANADLGDVNRMKFASVGMQKFFENPIWGNGALSSYHFLGTYSHNNYIELLMNGGIIAFGLFYAMHAYIASHVSKIIKKEKARTYSSLAIMILAILLFKDIGVVSYYERHTFILIAMCMCKFIPPASETEDSGEIEEKTV